MKNASRYITLIIVFLLAVAIFASGCSQMSDSLGTDNAIDGAPASDIIADPAVEGEDATPQTEPLSEGETEIEKETQSTEDQDSQSTESEQDTSPVIIETPESVQTPIITYVSYNSKVYSSTAEMVAAVADTVVEISTESVATQWGRQYIVSGAGSGVLIGKKENVYYIVTNHHVISDAREITVRTRAGDSYAGTLIAADDSTDIAVITITSTAELRTAVLGNSDDLQIGEDLIAIGNPLGNLGGTVTKGILSATGRSIQINNYTMTLLQTDTAINPGNSGGGLFNMKGELIGVVNAKTSDEEIEGICFAIPINIAVRVYDDLIKYGYINGRATFNIEVVEASGYNLVYIASVNSNSSENFEQYDMIYKINGKEITSLLDYNTALSSIMAGEAVEVEVYRGSLRQSFWNSGINFDSESTTFNTTAQQYGLAAE